MTEICSAPVDGVEVLPNQCYQLGSVVEAWARRDALRGAPRPIDDVLQQQNLLLPALHLLESLVIHHLRYPVLAELAGAHVVGHGVR